MLSAIALSLLGAMAGGAPEANMTLTIEKFFCLSESSDGIGADETYLCAITHKLGSVAFTADSSKVFESTDSGDTRYVNIHLLTGMFKPIDYIFVVALGECDHYDEWGDWLYTNTGPAGTQETIRNYADSRVRGATNELSREVVSLGKYKEIWKSTSPRKLKAAQIGMALFRNIDAGNDECLGYREIVIRKADVERAVKYKGKPTRLIQILQGDGALYQVECLLKTVK